jgi:hypothetical protein
MEAGRRNGREVESECVRMSIEPNMPPAEVMQALYDSEITVKTEPTTLSAPRSAMMIMVAQRYRSRAA